MEMQRKDVEIDQIQVKVLDIGDMKEESINVHINQDVDQDHDRLKGTIDTEKVLDTLTKIEKGEGPDHLTEKEGGDLDHLTEREESTDDETPKRKTFDNKISDFCDITFN